VPCGAQTPTYELSRASRFRSAPALSTERSW